MGAIIGLLLILTISLTIVRIGSISLELTGLSSEVSGFQAQSAFSGAGFTTSESESIVTHPVRRKIIRILMLIGSVGVISTGATLIVALIGTNNENFALRGVFLIGGLLACYILARSKIVYHLMKKIIVGILSRSKALQLHDYHDILAISKGYSISRIRVQPENWLIGKKLKELGIQKEGTTILAITRRVNAQEKHIIPHGETMIEEGDLLTIYGRCTAMDCLFMRPKGEKGDMAHQMRKQQRESLINLGNTESV